MVQFLALFILELPLFYDTVFTVKSTVFSEVNVIKNCCKYVYCIFYGD